MLSCTIETPTLSHLTYDDFMQIYEPAEDTFLLLDALESDVKFIRQLKPTICLEIGPGSGVVSTALSRTLGSSVFCFAIDINKAACQATRRTAKHNGATLDVIVGDLVSPLLKGRDLIDLLVFNPPYVPTSSSEANAPLNNAVVRAWAGGERGREVMDHLFPLVPDILSPQGLFYLVAVSCNDVPGIQREMASLGFRSTVVKKRRVRGEHLVILRFKKEL